MKRILVCVLVALLLIGTVSASTGIDTSRIVKPAVPLVNANPGAPAVVARPTDTDGDGNPDISDNCPLVKNAGQKDSDNDGVGDACDNCWYVANKDQEDTNRLCRDMNFVSAYYDPGLNIWIKDPRCGDACRNTIQQVGVRPGTTLIGVARQAIPVEVAKPKEVPVEMEDRSLNRDNPNRTILGRTGIAPVNPNLTVRRDVIVSNDNPPLAGKVPVGYSNRESGAGSGEPVNNVDDVLVHGQIADELKTGKPVPIRAVVEGVVNVPAPRNGLMDSISALFSFSSAQSSPAAASLSNEPQRGFIDSIRDIFSSSGNPQISQEPPTVTNNTPEEGADGTLATVTIQGSHFAPGAHVFIQSTKYEKGIRTRDATNVSVEDDQTITCTLDLTDLSLKSLGSGQFGVYQFHVRNPDGKEGYGYVFSVYQVDRPVITSVTPDTAYAGDAVTVTIEGTYFKPNTKIELFSSPRNTKATGLTLHSPEKITCTFDLTGIEPGAYSIMVHTPLVGITYLHDSFHVLPPLKVMSPITPNNNAVQSSPPVNNANAGQGEIDRYAGMERKGLNPQPVPP